MVIGVSVPQANDILGASYQIYRHVATHDTVLRTVSYSLPKALYGYIQTVSPTTYFGSPLTQPLIRPREVAVERGNLRLVEPMRELNGRENFVTPEYIRWLYKTEGYVPAAANRNSIGIAGYLMEYPSLQDLRAFMTKFRTEGQDATFIGLWLNGCTFDPSNPGTEANLDLQLSEAITYPTRNVYYLTGGVWGAATDPYLNWLAYVLAQITIPQTISTSFSSDESNVPPDIADELCKLFAVLGVRGVSVLFSTGDWGVGGGDCVVPGGSGDGRFLPQFPASCTSGLFLLFKGGTQT